LQILFCLILGLQFQVYATIEPTKLFYTADYADVLSSQTERFISEHSASLAENTGAQIVVATVETLDGNDVMEYGLELLRSWQVGSEKDNGVVILVSTGDRKIGVNVGYGLEGALNDSKIGRLLDTCAIPSLQNNDYDTGIFQLYNAVLAEVYHEYQMEVPETVKSLEDYESESEDSVGMAIIATIMFLAIFLSFFTKNRGGRNGSGGGYHGPYFGGYGGGSYHGSGGGFGGFRGGGGSGGGGGASRGF